METFSKPLEKSFTESLPYGPANFKGITLFFLKEAQKSIKFF